MSLLIESFVFGAANSVHCACMCGPLAIAFGTSPRATAAYQAGRGLSYTTVGAVLGGTGALLGSREVGVPTATAAYVLAFGLVVLALVGERGGIVIPGLDKVLARVTAAGRRLSPTMRAALLGLCTPLLPCGLLWSACAGATVAGSLHDGASVMFGFALGSLPLLLLAQWKAPSLARRLSPRTLKLVQTSAMLLAAGVLVWRGALASQGGSCH